MELNRINPVALITGAASGIGEAAARAIAKRASGGLILVAPDANELDRVADLLGNDAPERVSTLAFDVADTDRWVLAADFIKSQYGRLDWAILNTGVAPAAAGAESDLVDWRHLSSSDLEGAAATLKALTPLLSANTQGGAVVVSAAAAAVKAEPKAGLSGFVRAAAKDAFNIRINGLAPGGAETPLWNSMPWFHALVAETGGEPAAFDRIATLERPVARYAKSDDVVRPIALLLSDDSTITGATLVVDGGYTL